MWRAFSAKNATMLMLMLAAAKARTTSSSSTTTDMTAAAPPAPMTLPGSAAEALITTIGSAAVGAAPTEEQTAGTVALSPTEGTNRASESQHGEVMKAAPITGVSATKIGTSREQAQRRNTHPTCHSIQYHRPRRRHQHHWQPRCRQSLNHRHNQ